MPELDGFGFRGLWSPFVILLALFVATLYLYLIGPMRGRFKDSGPVPLKQKIRFFCGLFALYMALGGPLNLLAHLMFSYHMLSMAVAYLVAPPLILLGLPAWLLRPIFNFKFVKAISRVLLFPIFTLFIFNGLFSLYHVPFILDTVMMNKALHAVGYLVLLFAAFLMWWPVVNPIPEQEILTDLKKMGYVFANGVLLTPACALIIFANDPLFSIYNDPESWVQALGFCVPGDPAVLLQQFEGPQNYALLPPRDDQQLGGIVMKFTQEIMYGSILAYNFRKWYQKEKPYEVDEIPEVMPDVDQNWNKA